VINYKDVFSESIYQKAAYQRAYLSILVTGLSKPISGGRNIMEEKLVGFIESLKTKRLADMDEASTKQAIVIKMLSLLGWDIFDVDEVKPDLAVKSHTVDISLRPNNTDSVFINVKKVNAALDKHQKQLLACARAEGVKLSILTNGMAWWFYLSLQEGGGEQKKFCSIDLLKQNPKDSHRYFSACCKETVLPVVNLCRWRNRC